MGYVVTGLLFFFSWLVGLIPAFSKVSHKLMLAAEYVQCFSIYFLLRIQPWYRCENNFQSIYGFYDQYKTRKVMFVANHRSNLDTFILISLIPGLRGMAKKSLFYNIFFGPIMLLIGFVPVDKGSLNSFREGIRLLQTRILGKNRPALVFPETTRCKKHNPGIEKFSDAVFVAAMEADALVVPILIKNTDRILGRGDLLIHPYEKAEVFIYDPIPAVQYKDQHQLSMHVKNFLLEKMSCV